MFFWGSWFLHSVEFHLLTYMFGEKKKKKTWQRLLIDADVSNFFWSDFLGLQVKNWWERLNLFRRTPVSHVIKAINWDLEDMNVIPIPVLLQTYYLMLRKSSWERFFTSF